MIGEGSGTIQADGNGHSAAGSGDIVLVQMGVPDIELAQWSRELAGMAVITPPRNLESVTPAKDTLVVTLWSNGSSELFADSSIMPDLQPVMLSSTRVVGIYIDEEKATALAADNSSPILGLYWLREISGMVVVSSDGAVVVELVTTLAKAAR